MSSTPERSVRLDGTGFRYRETGDSSGPVLVLLYALGENASDWDEVAAAFSNRYRVLALDQRGHGQSEHTARYSLELMRDDLRDFVDALGLEQFSLMGHSMGGLVALLFAEEHPERVQRLVIEDAAPPAGSSNRPEPPPEPPEPVSFDWRVVAPIRRQLNSADPAWWDRLPRITAPTLVVVGWARDRWTFVFMSGSPDRAENVQPAAPLTPRFAMLNYYRRGYDDSGEVQPWAIEREVEDLKAAIDEAGGSAFVFGNPGKGSFALEAADCGLGARILKPAEATGGLTAGYFVGGRRRYG